LSLRHEISRIIAERTERAIPFFEYMQLCLYHETYGYYRANRVKIGKDGDFYTSSALGGLLAETVVHYLLHQASQAQVIALDRPLLLVEWGGGTGQFASQFLDELKSCNEAVYEQTKYVMIEESEYHRTLQQDALKAHEGHVVWQTGAAWLAESATDNTFVFSNELLDAFAVHRVVIREKRLHEIWVTEENGLLAETYIPLPADCELAAYAARYYPDLLEGQIAEINLQAVDWLRRVLQRIASGLVFTVDYGDVAAELASPHRMNGTLLCYYRHMAADNPYERPGEQDMTAHVNFSAMLDAGEAARVSEQTLQTQLQFLTDNGLLQKLQETLHIRDPFHPAVKRNRMIRQLLLSDGMSELFKVLIQIKTGKHARLTVDY
jgi:SAM-dependent MidA family methyltransferase